MGRADVYLIPSDNIYEDAKAAMSTVGSWLGFAQAKPAPVLSKCVATVEEGSFSANREALLLALETNHQKINFGDYLVHFELLSGQGFFAPADDYMIKGTTTFRVTLEPKKEKKIISEKN